MHRKSKRELTELKVQRGGGRERRQVGEREDRMGSLFWPWALCDKVLGLSDSSEHLGKYGGFGKCGYHLQCFCSCWCLFHLRTFFRKAVPWPRSCGAGRCHCWSSLLRLHCTYADGLYLPQPHCHPPSCAKWRRSIPRSPLHFRGHHPKRFNLWYDNIRIWIRWCHCLPFLKS